MLFLAAATGFDAVERGPFQVSDREQASKDLQTATNKVGTNEGEKFAALQSLAKAEMRRIHHLYYCMRLRFSVMYVRFAFLNAIASQDGHPRQPVPQGQQVPADRDDRGDSSRVRGDVRPGGAPQLPVAPREATRKGV